MVSSLNLAQLNIVRTADDVNDQLAHRMRNQAEKVDRHNRAANTIKAIALIVGIIGTIAASVTGMVCGILATVTGAGATAGVPLMVAGAMGLISAISLSHIAKGKIKVKISIDDNNRGIGGVCKIGIKLIR